MTTENFQPSWERKAIEERRNLQKQLETLKGQKVVAFDFDKDDFDFLMTFEDGTTLSFMIPDPITYPVHDALDVHPPAAESEE